MLVGFASSSMLGTYTPVQAFSNLTRTAGGISAQCLRDRLYAFFENHSNSCDVNNCCFVSFGRLFDALACASAWDVSKARVWLDNQPTPLEHLAQLLHDMSLDYTIFGEIRLEEPGRNPAVIRTLMYSQADRPTARVQEDGSRQARCNRIYLEHVRVHGWLGPWFRCSGLPSQRRIAESRRWRSSCIYAPSSPQLHWSIYRRSQVI